jgi:hypothetical protein
LPAFFEGPRRMLRAPDTGSTDAEGGRMPNDIADKAFDYF